MNKRQRKKLVLKRADSRPWAGWFSRMVPDELEEVCVIYVARPIPGTAERKVTEERVISYTPDPGAAIQYCRDMVDHFLTELYQTGMTIDELYSRYRNEGPDPYVIYEERGGSEFFTNSIGILFNAWGYAEVGCRRLCGEEPGEASRGLAHWQGRYQEYDRKRMAAQLLLWRRVCLTRECSGLIGTFPVGTEGTIGMHAYYVGDSTFDWSVELPVVFDVADERGQVTFGVPYAALEFVESDETLMGKLAKDS